MSRETVQAHITAMLARAIEVRAESHGKTSDVAAGFADGLLAALEAINQAAAPLPNGHRYMVILGNPLTGLTFYGPFNTHADAEAWGERHAARSEFWLAPLTATPPPEPGPRLAVNNDDPSG